MQIKITLGDKSRDGHGLTETFFFESNRTAAEVAEAYRAGMKKLKWDFGANVCAEYEDSVITHRQIKPLLDAGYRYEGYDEVIDPDEELDVDGEWFVDMFLFIVKLGDPQAQLEIVDIQEVPLYIGYGLYYL